MKLGVVGSGVVGNAFYEGMKHAFDVVRYDKFNASRSDVQDIEVLCSEVDGPLFVCVPTPMNPDGSCNTEIIESVLQEIYQADFSMQTLCCGGKTRIVVIKSTIPPGTTNWLNVKFSFRSANGLPRSGLDIVFNPEFLTEASPVEDFKKQDRIVLGGDAESIQIISEIYTLAYPNVTQVLGGATSSEMVKYVANCFLAMKVSFANEIYQICKALDVDYNGVINTATLDKRLGSSHWQVPGPDGHFGFGLACFPKDLNALMSLGKLLNVDVTMLDATWKKNLIARPEKDWEQMKGRAVL